MSDTRAKSSDVDAQLERICASAEFCRSAQITRLLRFLIDYSLDPADGPLNERLIGEKVFDRRLPDYDPKLDPIVRTEARRLRQKLEAYYSRAGHSDPIRVTIPKGAYTPQFEYAVATPVPAVVEFSPAPAVSSTPESHASRRILSWSLAGVALTVVILGLTWYRFSARTQAAHVETPYEVVPFANEIGTELAPAISPDGSRIAYVWDGNADNFDIYVQTVEGRVRSRLTADPAQDMYPAWSPDGQSIAFLRSTADRTEVVVKPAGGGPERTITQIRAESSNWSTDLGPGIGNAGPAWSPDGHHLAVSDWCGPGHGFGLYLVSTDTFERRSLTTPPAVVRDLYPRISPDGKSVAFVRYSTHGVGELHVQPLAGGDPRQLTSDHSVVRGISWTPDSQGLIFGSNRGGNYRLWTIGREGGALSPLPTNTTSASDPVIARNAGWLAFVDENQNWTIWRARLRNGKVTNPERFLSSSGRNHTPRYSPDGKRIAFVSNRSGDWEIWICDGDGQNPRQVTHFRGPWLGGLNWSPDGRHLAFDGRINQHSAVFVIDAEGGEPQVVEKNEFENRMPNFSRDGRFLYFNSNRSGIVAIWKEPVAGGPPTPLSGVAAFQSMESEGTPELYFDSGTIGIWRSRTDGSSPLIVPELAHVSPRLNWTVSQRGLYFADNSSGTTNIWMYDFSAGRASIIGKADKPFVLDTPSLSVSPDEHWILYAQQEHTSSDIEIRRVTGGSSRQ